MQKAIIIVTGTPTAQKEFMDEIREDCWLWKTNIKDKQKPENFLLQSINKFRDDDSCTKTNRGKEYEKFILVLQNVPKRLYDFLISEFGAFQIHVGIENELEKERVKHDFTICYDSPNFKEQVRKVVGILVN